MLLAVQASTADWALNVEKNAAYPKAIADLKASRVLPEWIEPRQDKYLNNLIEQHHRFIKRLVKPRMDSFSFETARNTLQEYESMNMIRQGAYGRKGECHRVDLFHCPPV